MSVKSVSPVVKAIAVNPLTLNYDCPYCGAVAGRVCQTKAGLAAKKSHAGRIPAGLIQEEAVKPVLDVVIPVPIPVSSQPSHNSDKKDNKKDNLISMASHILGRPNFGEAPSSKMAMHLLLDFNQATIDNADGKYPKGYAERRRLPHVAGSQYDPAVAFMPKHETRVLLDSLVPEGFSYLIVTLTGSGKQVDEARDINISGAELAANQARRMRTRAICDQTTGKRYRCVYAHSTDDDIFMLYVEIGSGIEKPADLGLVFSDDPKLPKRAKRLFAPYPMLIKARITAERKESAGLVQTAQLATGKTIEVLWYDVSPLNEKQLTLVNGMGVNNLKGCDGTMGTILGREMGKGIYHANPRVKYDLVIYEGKQEAVLVGKDLYIGVLGDVSEHPAYMDIQTMTNMGWFGQDLCQKVGIETMQALSEVMFRGSEDEVRDLLAKLVPVARKALEKNPDKEGWALIKAAELGHETKTQPVFQRRFMTYLFENSVDLTKGRIPMFNRFGRFYVRPNPLMFDQDGTPVLAWDVLGRNVCIPDAPAGPVWLVRNPNTNSKEGVLVINVHIPELMKYKGRGYVFLGAEAIDILPKLNGGDMDDSVLVTWDIDFVRKAESMNYPVQPKVACTDGGVKCVSQNPHIAANQQHHRGLATGHWNFNVFETQLQQFSSYQTSLGTFINRGMLDTLLSGEHREAILASLLSENLGGMLPNNFKAPSKEDLGKLMPHFYDLIDPSYDEKTAASYIEHVCLPYCASRPDFLCRVAMSNSDLVIDYTQMRKGDKQVVDQLFDESALAIETPYFPVSYQDRMPAARKAAGNYVLVSTELCRCLAALTAERDRILEAGRQLEYLLIRPLSPKLVQMFGADDPTIRDHASYLRSEWGRGWNAMREAGQLGQPGGFDGLTAKQRKEAFTKAYAELAEKLDREYRYDSDGRPFTLETRLAFCIAYLNGIYSRKNTEPRIDGQGFTQSVADAVPNFMLLDLLTAETMAGLTGQVAFIQLNQCGRAYMAGHALKVPVKILDGMILRYADGKSLSSAAYREIPDGTYLMSPEGVIVVKQANKYLRSDYVAQASDAAGSLSDMQLDQDYDSDFAADADDDSDDFNLEDFN